MFTVYDTENDEYSKVEEPDPSLTYTYADYLRWNFEERLELIKGRIFKMSPAPSPVHQRVQSSLNALFYNFLKKKKCTVYPAPFDVRLPVKNRKKDNQITTVLQPDLCVVCDDNKIDARGCNGAPDLVVEILSPGNAIKDAELKFELYEKAGVKEFWVIHPTEETVLIFVLGDDGRFGGGHLYAGYKKIQSKILPGFETDLSEIFSN